MAVAADLVVPVSRCCTSVLVPEMFLWDTPRGLQAFGPSPPSRPRRPVLAANQGLYNGFLAAGLFWGWWLGARGAQ